MTDFKQNLLVSCDARSAHELSKNPTNGSIQATLTTMRKSFDNDAIASALLACNVNPDFLNKSERNSNRFNVYAAEKVLNIGRVIAKNPGALNHYTRAIVLAASALALADCTLTHADAVAACSLSVAHKDKSRAKIIKSAVYQKHVAANTAATQSSSSINALQVCNVLTETRDSANHVCYSLTDCDATRELIALAAQ
jgi:hypothetical protein